MFRPVSSRVNLAEVEEKVLGLWRQKDTFKRSIEARRGRPRFTLYEGPPTANGSPGIHHVLSRVFKDIIPRYKAMKGYYTPRIAGWDTHGLPVELEVEKELGFSGKAEIERFGIDKFNARCRESVFRYKKEWDELTERIAFWLDLEHPYITMDNDYIESCWWALKQMWDKGLVYQGYKVTPHCPRCGTSLSSHEVALGYQDDVPDPSVYIKFKIAKSLYSELGFLDKLRGGYGDRVADFAKWLLDLVGEKNVYLLAWTTTPWTLPGNTALAVNADAEYAIVEVDNEYLILADTLREKLGLGDNRVVEKVMGRDLVGVHYEALYQIKIYAEENDLPGYRVIEGDFVSMEDGTGIVHIAPAYGEIDFEVGEKENLPLVHSVNIDGLVKRFPTGYTPSIYRRMLREEALGFISVGGMQSIPGHGKFVKDADPLIIADLKSRGLLFRSETIRHTYPFCWRCEAPLLYYAKQTWYIRTTAVKDRLTALNDEINWYPEHIKYGRFGDWLANNVDWAFSRERYWGTPLPVWHCDSCGTYDCIGSLAELKEKPGFAGLKEPLDLHRPFVDELSYDCPQCPGRMERVPEVIDCWFDSGAMPIAQWHYPFENDSLFGDGRFPADYISEAVDQTRGWFYSLHAISTLLFDRPCYKNVICLGHILDAKGEKMSTSRGNVVEPWAVIDKYGADAVRWYFFTATPPGNARRFSEKLVAEVTRQFLLTLWNVYSFFVTYANIDRFTPASGEAQVEPSELDCWIISELQWLIKEVDTALDAYNPTEAGRRIEDFVNYLSNWYVRRSRRRFWKSENDADKLAAYSTLYQCLVTLSKLLAPFTPFLAEELYQNLVCSAFPQAPDSVHLTDFPVADEARIDKQLSADTRLAMKVSSLGRAARSFAGIKVRQPLSEVVVNGATSKEQAGLEKLKEQVLEELNVKKLSFDTISEEIKPLDVDLAGTEAAGVKVGYIGSPPVDEKSVGYVVILEAGYKVAISKQITPELEAEGLAREIVHRLQTMRRSAGFDIADYITTYYQGDEYTRQVIDTFAEYIKRETLSRELIEGLPGQGVFSQSHRLAGHDILLAVAKLA